MIVWHPRVRILHPEARPRGSTGTKCTSGQKIARIPVPDLGGNANAAKIQMRLDKAKVLTYIKYCISTYMSPPKKLCMINSRKCSHF
jgi:hypothetical protein